MMNIIIFVAALVAYLLFLLRFAWQGIVWFRASGATSVYPVFLVSVPVKVYISSALDILFFRRIFSTSRLLWLGSWLFHLSLLFVALRHMRFIFPSLPDWLIILQPVGLVAGYLLPFSLAYLMAMRTLQKKDRYTSSYNYMISGMLLLISAAGLLMRTFFRPDVVSVKQFTLGIFGLSPQALPESGLFLFHIGIFIALLPYLPTHIIAAPFVNLEANRRTEELRHIIHER